MLVTSSALTPTATFETEAGTVTSPATTITDATASGGNAVKFGASSGSPSGEAMPTGDLPGWKQIFADDFTTNVALGSFPGSAYSNRWFPYNAGSNDTSGYGTYNAAKTASVSGGILDNYLHTENGTHYVNAMVPLVPATGWGQLYGRYSIRLKADNMSGYKMAPLLWTDSETWSDGEVDWPEVNVFAAGEQAGANIYKNGTWVNYKAAVIPTSGWHTYTSEWSPGLLTFYVDGAQVFQTTQNVPSVSMHYVLQLETWIGAGAPPDTAAGHVQVDWFTMYSKQ